MTSTLRNLLAAGATAAALLAAPAARADHEGRQLPGPAPGAPPPPAYAPPSAPYAHRAPAPVGPEPRWERWEHRRAWLQLRAEVRRLEQARADFYASWRGNPWRQARFERWYAARRAELDRRREWLASRGWRGDWFAQQDD